MKKSILYTVLVLVAAAVAGVLLNDLIASLGGGVGMAMALTGYIRVCSAQSGGSKYLWLVEVADLTSFTFVTPNYTVATMESGKVFKKYEFEPDTMEVKETTAMENGNKKVTHDIEFYIKKMSATSRAAVEEIADASACGLVAIFEDNNGTKWVIGYSENHLKSRALYLASGEATTGKTFSDNSGTTLKLQSVDNTNMRPFTGTVPIT